MKRLYWIIGAVAAVPIALKLSGWIAWNWPVVLVPALGGLVVLALLYLFLVIFAVGYGAAAHDACQAELSSGSRRELRTRSQSTMQTSSPTRILDARGKSESADERGARLRLIDCGPDL